MQPRRHTEVIKTLVELTGRHTADIGCGRGEMARWMQRQDARVIGVDPSPEAVRTTRSLGVAAVAASADALPFPAATFDFILVFNSLHHFPEPMSGLREARRVIRDAGALYVAEPVAAGSYFKFMQPVDDETETRAQAIDALTRAAHEGWRLEAQNDYAYEVVVTDLEAEMARWLAVDPRRRASIDAQKDVITERFQSLGEPSQKGRSFFQPMRVWLLCPR